MEGRSNNYKMAGIEKETMINQPGKKKSKKKMSKKRKACLICLGVFVFTIVGFIVLLVGLYVTSEIMTSSANHNHTGRYIDDMSIIRNSCGYLEISELRNKTRSVPDLRVPTTDEFMLKFLYSEMCNVTKAFNRMMGYFEFPLVHPDFFGEELVPSHYLELLRTNSFGYCEERDQLGRLVLFGRVGQIDPHEFTPSYGVRAMRLTAEYFVENVETQISGVVAIVDLDGLTMTHVLQASVSMVSQSVCFFQNCFPGRYEAVHVINAPWIANIVIKMVMPFLKEEMKERLFLHETNRLTEYVDPAILPLELGGQKPWFNASGEIEALLRWEPKWMSFQAEYGFHKNVTIDRVNVCN